MSTLEIYCVTNKQVNFLHETDYKIAWVGKEKILPNYKAVMTKIIFSIKKNIIQN